MIDLTIHTLVHPTAERLPSRMKLSVIIVNYKSRAALLECLASLEADGAGIETEIVVVDNDSRDGTPEALAERAPALRVVANADNVGYARAINQGIAATTGAFVLAMNPDCVVRPRWVGAERCTGG